MYWQVGSVCSIWLAFAAFVAVVISFGQRSQRVVYLPVDASLGRCLGAEVKSLHEYRLGLRRQPKALLEQRSTGSKHVGRAASPLNGVAPHG